MEVTVEEEALEEVVLVEGMSVLPAP